MRIVRALIIAAVTASLLTAPALAQWPTTCVELNDIVENHLGNDHNVGIYQRVFGDQAEQGCQNDHRDDVRGVFCLGISRRRRACSSHSAVRFVFANGYASRARGENRRFLAGRHYTYEIGKREHREGK